MSTNRLLSVYFNKYLRENRVSVSSEQWIVLAILWDNPGMSQEELGKHLSLEKSSLSRQIEIMERDGLVQRSRDETDRRRKLLTTTEKADRMKERCKMISEEARQRLLADIDPLKAEECIRVLAQVKHVAGSY